MRVSASKWAQKARGSTPARAEVSTAMRGVHNGPDGTGIVRNG